MKSRAKLLLLSVITSSVLFLNPPPVVAWDYDDPGADLAWDGQKYFAVWEDLNEGVFGAFVTPAGEVGARISVAPGPSDARDPSVAWNGRHFLVVWEHHGEGAIYGRLVEPDGALPSPAFKISASPSFNVDPAVAASGPGGPFLVTWQQLSLPRAIGGGLVTQDDNGATTVNHIVISPLSGSGSWGRPRPAVASDGQNFLVVWAADPPVNYPLRWNIYDIYGARVGRSGMLLDSAAFPISSPPILDGCCVNWDPDVAFNGRDYLVVWEFSPDRWREIRARKVDPAGVVEGAAPTTIKKGRSGGCCQDHPVVPVSSNGDSYLVAWRHSSGVETKVVSGSGDLVLASVVAPEAAVDLCGTAYCGEPLTAASDGRDYFVVTSSGVKGFFVSAEGSVAGSPVDIRETAMANSGDSTPPTVTITSAPPQLTTSKSAQVEFASDDPGSQFNCRLDYGSIYACSSPQTYSGLYDGAHEFTVWATDAAGNTGSASHGWTVDSTSPGSPNLESPPDGSDTWDSTPAFEWSDVVDPSGVAYSLQVDDQSDFSSPAINQGGLSQSAYEPNASLTAGTHYWRVSATDGAGNIGSWSSTWTLTVKSAGAITGAVKESGSKKAIGGAEVDCGGGLRAVTSSTGSYSISNMSPGAYTCTASASGYKPVSRTVEVEAHRTAVADFSLRKAK